MLNHKNLSPLAQRAHQVENRHFVFSSLTVFTLLGAVGLGAWANQTDEVGQSVVRPHKHDSPERMVSRGVRQSGLGEIDTDAIGEAIEQARDEQANIFEGTVVVRVLRNGLGHETVQVLEPFLSDPSEQ